MNPRVYDITFKQPWEGKTDMYFGSMSAIFDLLPPEALGGVSSYSYLRSEMCRKNRRFENKRVIIRQGNLIRKKAKKDGE